MATQGWGGRGSQWCLGNSSGQFLAWHCFIVVGTIYCFLPAPKDDLGEWKASRKMQLSQEVGTCRSLMEISSLTKYTVVTFRVSVITLPAPHTHIRAYTLLIPGERWSPDGCDFSDCLNWTCNCLHEGKDVLLYFCSLTFLNGIKGLRSYF